MKTNLLLVAALVCYTFSGCGKKVVEPKKQVKLLTKITEVTNGRTTTKLVTYDSRNHLTAIGTLKFTWEGNDLVKMTEADVVKTIAYNNGIPVSINYRFNVTNDTYTYGVTEGRITIRTAPPFAPGSHKFTYVGNNATVTASERLGTVTYIYNADKSPFYNSRLKFLFNAEDVEYFSENSITEAIYQFSPRLGYTYSYLRDADGFPKSAVKKVNKPNDPDAFTYTDITYEYEMRDAVD